MKKLAMMAALVTSTAGCDNFLTGGDLSNDPTLATRATTSQLFVGAQSNIFYTYSGELPRIAGMFAQQITGAQQQYLAYYQYTIDEGTSNEALRQLYGPGGLSDVRRAQASALATADSVFLGILQVQEALLIGMAADVYGDVAYSEALTNVANVPLDPQLEVYDSLQVVLSSAIVNLSRTGPTNRGPGGNDLNYGGGSLATQVGKWTRLAHTLKARYYMHTAEVRGTPAYASALTEAAQGITSAADDYKAVYTGSPTPESNPWYQFTNGPAARNGYFEPNRNFDALLDSRGDPRRTDYFRIDPDADTADAISDTRLDPSYDQPIVTATENAVIWAEAAFRTGATGTALTQLNAARALAGYAGTVSFAGSALLREILTEAYIATFQLGVEGWKLYRRTCFPNLPNTSLTGTQMPGRLYYDVEERLTNTNIPAPGTDPNGKRNAVDPANATADAVGGACIAGA